MKQPPLGLPSYQCHKIVGASVIVGIARQASPDSDLIQTEHANVHVDLKWAPQATVGGYLVQYDDGHISYSPAVPFEQGYTLQPAPETEPQPERATEEGLQPA